MPLLDQIGKIETEEQAQEFLKSNWMEVFPQDARSNPNLTKYKTPDDFFKGHISAVERVGKSIVIPNEKSSPEEVSAFKKALGIPDKADGYKLTPLENLHPNIKLSEESAKPFLELAHQANLTPGQVDLINKWYLSNVDAFYRGQDKANEESLTKLTTDMKNKWGADYDKKVALAKKMIEIRGGDELAKAFGSALDNPKVLEFLAKEGERYSEDDFKQAGLSNLTGEKADFKKFIELSNTAGTEENKALMDANNPQHHAVLEKRTKAYESLYGGEK